MRPHHFARAFIITKEASIAIKLEELIAEVATPGAGEDPGATVALTSPWS